MCRKRNRRLKSSIFNMFTGIKKFIIFGKNNIWNSATCSCENGKYLGNIIDDSAITCGEVRETTKAVSNNFNEKKSKLQNKKKSISYLLFINYHSVIDSCWYLLLPDKI